MSSAIAGAQKRARNLINKMLDLAEKEAKDTRISEGLNGYGNLGGRMEDNVAFYRLGLRQAVPSAWEKHYAEAVNQADPEWKEYVRLRKKFDE